MTAKRDYKGIYARSKGAGLDEDARRDVFEQQTGKRSLSLMTPAEVGKVDAHLKTLAPAKRGRKPASENASVRFIHVLWRLLGDAGALNDPTRAGLNKFLQKRFGEKWGAAVIDVDALTDHRQIATVIEALKDWCAREGVELDR